MSMRFCPYCGKPRAATDATFCGYCGRSFAAATPAAAVPGEQAGTASGSPSPASPSPYASAPVPPAYPANPANPANPAYPGYPGYPVPAPATPPLAPGYPYGAPVATAMPPAMQRPSQKSAGLAILLEWFVPGAGAMYAGVVGIGVGWLVGTYAWGILSAIMLLSAIREVNQPTPFSIGEQNYTPLIAVSLILTALGIGWFVIRLLVVNQKIRDFNQQLAGGISSNAPWQGQPGQGAGFDGGRAASSAALALVVPVLIPSLALSGVISLFYDSPAQTFFYDALFSVATLVPFAFAVAIFRLPKVLWWRALIETLVGIAIMQAVLLAGYLVTSAVLLGPKYSLSYTFLAIYPVEYVLFEFLVPVLIASGIGFAIGLLFSRWQTVRGSGAGGNSLLFAGLALVVGIVAQLALNAAILNADLHAPFADLAAIGVANYVLVIAIAVGAILAAAFIMRARLKRLATAVQP